ncbi:unnamed protein product, partial [Mesorhabditis belari]|uniref:Uncharacterized protein n=1 Tax=Mesorhabditis belari TaxID=2138241 RepID=A0AAF3EZX5_9BILA
MYFMFLTGTLSRFLSFIAFEAVSSLILIVPILIICSGSKSKTVANTTTNSSTQSTHRLPIEAPPALTTSEPSTNAGALSYRGSTKDQRIIGDWNNRIIFFYP